MAYGWAVRTAGFITAGETACPTMVLGDCSGTRERSVATKGL